MTRIALDYDNTYTLDPVLWDAFVAMAFVAGHDVRIVTIRDEQHDRTTPLIELEKHLPVIYCRGVAKDFWCLHHADWQPDIWIDDSPRTILENSKFSPEDLAAWRTARNEAI